MKNIDFSVNVGVNPPDGAFVTQASPHCPEVATFAVSYAGTTYKEHDMLIAYLLIGFLFGTGTAAFALVNGGGILMALMAYGASGAIAILAPIALHSWLDAGDQNAWADDTSGHISA